jgi:hypothetical protein
VNEHEYLSDRLTPRAAEMLASLLDEMRHEVLESAARRGLGLEISARDIIEAFEERTGEQRLYASLVARRQGRLQWLLGTYAAIGLLAAVAAISLSGLDGQRSEWSTLLVSTSVAIVGASLGLLWSSRRREAEASAVLREEERRQHGFATFVERWFRIENLLRLLVAKDLGKSAAEMPLGAIMEALLASGRVDDATYASLRGLLTLRNSAVHGGTVEQDSLVNAIRTAERLVWDFEEQLAA